MSSDNYYLIRPYISLDDYSKYFVVTMCFASDYDIPPISWEDHWFTTLEAANAWAQDQYSEYGVEIHSDCYVPDMNLWDGIRHLSTAVTYLLALAVEDGKLSANKCRELLGLPVEDYCNEDD
jgi:hypothetical protein